MSAVSAAASSLDWPVIGAAVGTFITACWATWQGIRKGKAKVESGSSTVTSLVGGTIMDSIVMKELTDALKQNTECTRENTRELQRHNDIVVMIGRKD
jgi:hypothetical protein